MTVDLAVLYPPFRTKALALQARCAALGCEYRLTSGVRTFAEQDTLYAIGRTTGTKGAFVTKARGGQSYHNYGVAVDFVRITNSSADWSRAAYSALGAEAKALGLEWGGNWQFIDVPHVQLPVCLGDLQAAYKTGGIQAVWAWLDSHA